MSTAFILLFVLKYLDRLKNKVNYFYITKFRLKKEKKYLEMPH